MVTVIGCHRVVFGDSIVDTRRIRDRVFGILRTQETKRIGNPRKRVIRVRMGLLQHKIRTQISEVART